MININNIKIGQKVWYQEHWSQMIVWGKVTNITKFDNNEYGIEVTGEFHEEGSFVGTTTQPLDNLYATKYEAIEAIRKSRQAWVDTYKKEITDIASLVAFPLLHSFGAEEYTNYEAIRAYKERAKELGFEIPD
jgi:hypothetical protein